MTKTKLFVFILITLFMVFPNLALIGNIKDTYDEVNDKKEIKF